MGIYEFYDLTNCDIKAEKPITNHAIHPLIHSSLVFQHGIPHPDEIILQSLNIGEFKPDYLF